MHVVFRRYVLGKKPRRSRRSLKPGATVTIFMIMIGAFVFLFLGAMIVVIGGIAIHPPMMEVAKPLVCPAGEMEFLKHAYSYKPGQSGYQILVYCRDRISEEREEVTNIAVFGSMAIYAAILFVASLMMAITRRWLLPGLWRVRSETEVRFDQRESYR